RERDVTDAKRIFFICSPIVGIKHPLCQPPGAFFDVSYIVNGFFGRGEYGFDEIDVVEGNHRNCFFCSKPAIETMTGRIDSEFVKQSVDRAMMTVLHPL